MGRQQIETQPHQRPRPVVTIDASLEISNNGQFDDYINELRGEVNSEAVRPYVVFDRKGVMVIGVEDVENGEKTTILTAKVIRITDLPYVKTQLEGLFPEEGGNRDFIQPAIDCLVEAYSKKDVPVFFLEQGSVVVEEVESLDEIEKEGAGSSPSQVQIVDSPASRSLTPQRIDIPVDDRGAKDDRTTKFVNGVMSFLTGLSALSNKEVRNQVREGVLEVVETYIGRVRARSDMNKQEHLRQLLSSLEAALPGLGFSGGLSDFLLRGFRDLQQQGVISKEVDPGSPEGIRLMIEKVAIPAMATITAASEVASERADAEAEVSIMQLKAELAPRRTEAENTLAQERAKTAQAIIEADRDIEKAKIDATADIAAKRKEQSEKIASGRIATGEIVGASFEGFGKVVSGFVRGMVKVPVEAVRGLSDAAKEFVKKEPLIATGVAAATALWAEAAIAGTAIPSGWIIACIGGGVGLEVLWDRIIAPAIEPWLETRGINIHHEDDNDESV